MSSVGTKVTKDPAAQQATPEAPGIITSDSLAAESKQHGGAFGDSRAVPSDQPSKGTTTNNTETSGATVLPPAKDKAERDEEGAERVDEKLELERGKGANDGRGPTYDNVGSEKTDSSTEQKNTTTTTAAAAAANSTSSDETQGVKDASASDAPSYAAAAGGSIQSTTQSTKPKDTDLSSGNEGFKGDEPNASFSTAIGTEDDPGLLAEQKIQALNAQSGADAGIPKQTVESGAGGKIEDESQYKVLGETSS